MVAGFGLFALASGLLATWAPADDAVPAAAPGAGQPAHAGRVVEAPSNLRRFQPAEASTTLDGHEVVLRDVFEDLGPDATQWYQHVQTLANPFFEGRAPGTRGIELAAEYIENYFRAYGLSPAFETAAVPQDPSPERDVTYRQAFDFPRRDKPMEIVSQSLAINGEALEAGAEFTALGNAHGGRAAGGVTFVGYGIEDGPDGYNSFDDGADLTGRIALLLRYEPLNDEGRSRWAEQRFSQEHSAIAKKMAAVAKRNPGAILLVNPPGAVDGREGLEPLERSARFGGDLSIPAAQVTPEAAERLLAAGDPQHRSLTEWRTLADDGAVKTIKLADSLQVELALDLKQNRLETANVGGVLAGAGSLRDEWVILGAHYDHVGMGAWGTRSASNRGRLHPGADDNASGTAAMLVLARRLSEAYAAEDAPADRRSILFLAFSAEEIGLLGSKHFVAHPSIPLASVTLMVNMDMVGRLRSGTFSLGGVGTAAGLLDLLKPHIEASGLDVATWPGSSGQSDEASFFAADVPVLFAFTGMHEEYHAPGDQAYTVNPGGAAQVIEFIDGVVMELATRPERLAFTRPAGRGGADRNYAPVRLGIRPDMAAEGEAGILVGEVSEGTSAADAGLQAGDVLVMWNDTELTDMRSLFEQLQKHQPGDEVKLMVQRGEATLSIMVTLKASEQRPRRERE